MRFPKRSDLSLNQRAALNFAKIACASLSMFVLSYAFVCIALAMGK